MAVKRIDISEIRKGDVLVEAPELGKVVNSWPVSVNYGSEDRPNVGTGYKIFFDSGERDVFGAPQQVDVIRNDGVIPVVVRVDPRQVQE
jgi:hypothetical protein